MTGFFPSFPQPFRLTNIEINIQRSQINLLTNPESLCDERNYRDPIRDA
jgi:hypothetical protein